MEHNITCYDTSNDIAFIDFKSLPGRMIIKFKGGLTVEYEYKPLKEYEGVICG